jgi:hypothetical protein
MSHFNNPYHYPVVHLPTDLGPSVAVMVEPLTLNPHSYDGETRRKVVMVVENFRVNGKAYSKFIMDFYVLPPPDSEAGGPRLHIEDMRAFDPEGRSAVMTGNGQSKVIPALRTTFAAFYTGPEWEAIAKKTEEAQRHEIKTRGEEAIKALAQKMNEVRALINDSETMTEGLHVIVERMRKNP